MRKFGLLLLCLGASHVQAKHNAIVASTASKSARYMFVGNQEKITKQELDYIKEVITKLKTYEHWTEMVRCEDVKFVQYVKMIGDKAGQEPDKFKNLISAPNGKGETGLMLAAFRGDLEMVNFLLKEGDPKVVNEKDSRGRTALMYARLGRYARSPTPFIERNLEKKEFQERFGKIVATHDSIEKALLDRGADKSVKDGRGYNYSDYLDANLEGKGAVALSMSEEMGKRLWSTSRLVHDVAQVSMTCPTLSRLAGVLAGSAKERYYENAEQRRDLGAFFDMAPPSYRETYWLPKEGGLSSRPIYRTKSD